MLLSPDPAFSPDPRANPHYVPSDTPSPESARMKAPVHHHLDSIDELDETGPFGGYHHDGPYEAIASNLALSPTDTRSRSMREFNPRLLRLGQHQSASRVPFLHGEPGLSLQLEPGQVLQQNTVYASFTPNSAPVPSRSRPQPTVTRPDHPRSQSLPDARTRCSRVSSSLDPPDNPEKRPSSLRAPPEPLPGDNTPRGPPLHNNCDPVFPVPHQRETAVIPPPRYESRLHGSGATRPQHTSLPTERTVPLHAPRHRSIRSLDSSHATNIVRQPSLSIHHKPLEPPRMRYLPKRLVMPAPLQPQPPPPPPHNLSLYESVADEHPDDHDLEGAHPGGSPAMHVQEPRHLRRRSSAFPAKEPIPDHAPLSQEDAVPLTTSPPAKMATEAVETKERTRRRKLSKRKNDG